MRHWYPLLLIGIELIWTGLVQLHSRASRRHLQARVERENIRNAKFEHVTADLGAGWRAFEVLLAAYHLPAIVIVMRGNRAKLWLAQIVTVLLYTAGVAYAQHRIYGSFF